MYKSITTLTFSCNYNYLHLESLCDKVGYNGTRGAFVFHSRVFVLSRSTGAYKYKLKNHNDALVMLISETFCLVDFRKCHSRDVSLLASLCAVIGIVPVNA